MWEGQENEALGGKRKVLGLSGARKETQALCSVGNKPKTPEESRRPKLASLDQLATAHPKMWLPRLRDLAHKFRLPREGSKKQLVVPPPETRLSNSASHAQELLKIVKELVVPERHLHRKERRALARG